MSLPPNARDILATGIGAARVIEMRRAEGGPPASEAEAEAILAAWSLLERVLNDYCERNLSALLAELEGAFKARERASS